MCRFILCVGLLTLPLLLAANIKGTLRTAATYNRYAATYNRYLERLDQQKIRIEALQEQIKKLQAQELSHKKPNWRPARGVGR